MIYICLNTRDPVGFFQAKLLVTSQTCQPAAKADLFDGFERLHFTPCPPHQWEFGLGKDSAKEARRCHIFASAICSHTRSTRNWTCGCRTFFTLSIMNFLVSPGPLFAMLLGIWVWGVESSAWQTDSVPNVPQEITEMACQISIHF